MRALGILPLALPAARTTLPPREAGTSMPKIVVYIRAADARSLEQEGKNVAEWVRGLVAHALQVRKEKL